MAQNIMLRKKFGLDNDEALVEKFRCSNAKMNGGWLYITSSFICFDTLLQQGDSRLAVKIEDVREVKKHKFAQVVDNGIKFAMKTGKVTQKRNTRHTHTHTREQTLTSYICRSTTSQGFKSGTKRSVAS